MNLSEVKSGNRIFRDSNSLNQEKVCADKESLNYLTFRLLDNSAITMYLEAPKSYFFKSGVEPVDRVVIKSE